MSESIIIFFQGILTFVSPCMLPMLPVYFIYLSAGAKNENNKKALISLLGFICGFTVIFVALGATASQIGRFLSNNLTSLNLFLGILVLLVGINFIYPLRNIFNFITAIWANHLQAKDQDERGIIKDSGVSVTERALTFAQKSPGFLASFFFGMAFAGSWSACISVNLAYALTLAANYESLYKGIYLLTVFSLGLAIPFLLFGLFFFRLKGAFTFLQRYSGQIQVFSGILMIIIGISMISGHFSTYLAYFNFT